MQLGNHAVVATDDERIADCCRGFGATVVMTSQSCENGISINPNFAVVIPVLLGTLHALLLLFPFILFETKCQGLG